MTEQHLDTWTCSAEQAANFAGVTTSAFATYRSRYGLFPDRKSGRGQAAFFRFPDVLALAVLGKAIQFGVPVDVACRIVNGRGYLHNFMRDEPATIWMKDGEFVATGGRIEDPYLCIPMHNIGIDVLRGFIHLIAIKMGDAVANECEERFWQTRDKVSGSS